MIDRGGFLRLAPGEEVRLRLTTVGAPKSWRGRIEQHVGSLLGFHHLRNARRNVRCYWNGCPYCKRGMRRNVKFETRLLLETPEGLREVTAYLGPRAHSEFGRAALVILHEGRDPMHVPLVWRRPGTGTTTEVVFA